ncbi:hypothetical protein NOCA2220016 [metagenome]|uniref:Uncharacterized protein n=1 Tax=metagenome TaxID=256318 RepID=A0A2P2BYJ2_9ZZZZ
MHLIHRPRREMTCVLGVECGVRRGCVRRTPQIGGGGLDPNMSKLLQNDQIGSGIPIVSSVTQFLRRVSAFALRSGR